MDLDRYSANIGESCSIVKDVPYDTLLSRIVEFSVRAAVAHSIDESEWEHEQLRRRGLGALQIFRNERAVWDDRTEYDAELAEARRERIDDRFQASNELNVELYRTIDIDLQDRWRELGYATPTLRHNMKPLFAELERDAADRAERAREGLLEELLTSRPQESS
ncbi:MAG TPA: hypothetical protein VGF18_03540 [Candidatus Tumulicola sp.]